MERDWVCYDVREAGLQLTWRWLRSEYGNGVGYINAAATEVERIEVLLPSLKGASALSRLMGTVRGREIELWGENLNGGVVAGAERGGEL